MQEVKNRIISRIRKIFSVWIFVQIGFVFSANLGDIIITEFFYKSAGNNYEYIELYNTTDSTINLIDWEIVIDGAAYPIDSLLNIDSLDYVVLVSFTGAFQDSIGNTYGSENDSTFPFNKCESECDVRQDDIYWLRFPTSSLDESGEIKLLDSDRNLIDEVIYSYDDGSGQSAEFILDPQTKSAGSLNDLGSNWRSSQHESDWLWDETGYENGSPLIANFITPSIFVSTYDTPNVDSTSNIIDASVPDSIIFRPRSDGYPGGYVAIQLTGSADNAVGTDVILDSLYWELKKIQFITKALALQIV